MKKQITTIALALTLGLTAGTVQAGNVVVRDTSGSDLLIVNNGDGSDFLEAIGLRRVHDYIQG
ncbi:hypothetical protein HFP51_11720 [Parasphingopyxis sp. CP4]|uniref:hypothetical protein n=1 Tax=Parasphingopyxis sp. CP4 TaxID=2724527 RepID=UPI0015A198D0|nr:hypothetical protein [Parasphingopyxis sp. CP4]QLC22789.1 hypothetical protein HFP51_11720 [Parasphingopyxis sp. CP4]